MEPQQPERTPAEGAIGIYRDEEEYVIWSEHNGVRSQVRVGGFNLYRIFGSIALLLEIDLPKKIGKAIRM